MLETPKIFAKTISHFPPQCQYPWLDKEIHHSTIDCPHNVLNQRQLRTAFHSIHRARKTGNSGNLASMFPAARHTPPLPFSSSYTVSRDNRVKIKRQIESFGPLSTALSHRRAFQVTRLMHTRRTKCVAPGARVEGVDMSRSFRVLQARNYTLKRLCTQTQRNEEERERERERERGRSNELAATWFSTGEKTEGNE